GRTPRGAVGIAEQERPLRALGRRRPVAEKGLQKRRLVDAARQDRLSLGVEHFGVAAQGLDLAVEGLERRALRRELTHLRSLRAVRLDQLAVVARQRRALGLDGAQCVQALET